MNVRRTNGQNSKKRRKRKREMNETLETNKERIEEKSKYIDSCDLDVASA